MEFKVEPGGTYDVVIVLKGDQRCRRWIAMPEPYQRGAGRAPFGSDEIPFTIRRGRIVVLFRVNGSKPLDMLFDTGADSIVIHPSAVEKGVALKFDGEVINEGVGGAVERLSSSDNRIEIAGRTWNHELIVFNQQRARYGGGVLGAYLFEDKVLEIDYDRMPLVLPKSLPAAATG